jgi:hypothetical protein
MCLTCLVDTVMEESCCDALRGLVRTHMRRHQLQVRVRACVSFRNAGVAAATAMKVGASRRTITYRLCVCVCVCVCVCMCVCVCEDHTVTRARIGTHRRKRRDVWLRPRHVTIVAQCCALLRVPANAVVRARARVSGRDNRETSKWRTGEEAAPMYVYEQHAASCTCTCCTEASVLHPAMAAQSSVKACRKPATTGHEHARLDDLCA